VQPFLLKFDNSLKKQYIDCMDNAVKHMMVPIHEDDIGFTKVRLPYGWCSNMAGGFPILHEGINYLTSEALFQALRFAPDSGHREAIAEIKSPMAAKLYAKKTERLKEMIIEQRSDLDLRNMILCVQMKVDQNPQLKQLLLETGDRLIVEDTTARKSRPDLFWGAIRKDDFWCGSNYLGNIWMMIRDDLK